MAQRAAEGEAARRWWILAATGGSLAIVLLDETVVGVALPTIRDDLGMSQLLSHWVVNAYLLVLTVFVAAAGRLGAVVGQGRVFIAGAAVFGAGSLASALSPGSAMLIAARSVQGLGGAALFAVGVAMTGIAFSDRERGHAIGLYGVIGTVAIALGPFVGGFLTDAASWRWIFVLNLPLVAVTIAIVASVWREPEYGGARPRFDGLGLVTLGLVLGPLVLALMQAPDWGWSSPAVIGLLLLSASALAAFVHTERRAADPLIELELLERPTVVGSNLVLASAQFTKIAVIVFGALYLQEAVGLSPFEAGAALLVAMGPVPFVGGWAGRITDRRGSRAPTLAGIVVMTAALAWLAAFAGESRFLLLVPGLLGWGLSIQFFFTPPETALMNAVPPEKRGEAGGIAVTAQMLGGTLGVAVLGAVLLDSGFAAVFALSAGVAAITWVAAYLLLGRGR
jgi:EmrB/QacA subfamily drug resistance transporter